jgi:hypothetical protein
VVKLKYGGWVAIDYNKYIKVKEHTNFHIRDNIFARVKLDENASEMRNIHGFKLY